MNILLHDIRFVLRVMRKHAIFSVFVILTLALGIGANTAIFSVASGVLLKALPYHDPDNIVFIWIHSSKRKLADDKLPAPPADYLDWKNQNQVFEAMSAFQSNPFTLTGSGDPERIDGVQGTGDFFKILGVNAALGRTFGPGDDQPGNHVVVLSDALWKRQFGADRAIVGKKIILNGDAHEVIGVMGEGFTFPQGTAMPAYLQFPTQPQLWTPLWFNEELAKDRSTFNLSVMARLKPGVTLSEAKLNMDGIANNIDEQFRKKYGMITWLLPMREQLVGDVRTALLVLLGAVGLVLLVACANVANLYLARSMKRQKEMAVRSALGGGRSRLVRLILTESLVLAILGGLLGLLLAYGGMKFLLSISPNSIPRVNEIGIDASVLAFTFVAILLTGLISGIVPAIQASRADLNTLLREEARSTTGSRRKRRTRDLLLVGEVGLALILLIAAGLLVRSFMLLQQIQLNFNPDNLLTMHIDLPDARYPEDRMNHAFFNQLLPRLSAQPNIQSVGLISNLPLSGAVMGTNFTIEGRPPTSPSDKPTSDYSIASPGFFTTLGIPIMRGRNFTEQDTLEAPGVVIINEALANKHWPNEDPLGKMISVQVGIYKGQRQVVGIAGNVRLTSLTEPPRPEMYVPYAQHPDGYLFLVAKTNSNPLALAPAVRREVLAIDKDLPITDVRTMEEVIATSQERRRFNLLLLSLFAGLSLVLTIIGVYGVVSYSVTQRVHEIGVRTALGASPSQIVRLVVKEGMLPALIGIGLGLIGAYFVTKVMSGMLYQVKPRDPVVFLFAAGVLILVALLATFIPAKRATRIDPVGALRLE